MARTRREAGSSEWLDRIPRWELQDNHRGFGSAERKYVPTHNVSAGASDFGS